MQSYLLTKYGLTSLYCFLPQAAVLRETLEHLTALKQRNMQLEFLLQLQRGGLGFQGLLPAGLH